MTNRDRLAIYSTILHGAIEPKSLHKLSFAAQTSGAMLKQYVDALVKYELLSRQDKQYTTTDKGRKFLALVDKALALVQGVVEC